MKQKRKQQSIYIIAGTLILAAALILIITNQAKTKDSTDITTTVTPALENEAGQLGSVDNETVASHRPVLTLAPDDKRYIEPIANEVIITTDVVYQTVKNEKGEMQDLALDVYTPANDTQTCRPAILFMHGGGLTKGDKASEGLIVELAKDYAKRGYVTFNMNYRLVETYSQNALVDSVQDAASAFAWIQENSEQYGVDKTRIAIAGYSSGGNIAINLAYSNTDIFKIDRSAILGIIDLAGGMLSIGEPKEGNPSCILLHGTGDTTAPYQYCEAFSNVLTQKNVRHTLYPLKELNHELMSRYDEIRNQITQYLYFELTGKEIAVTTKASPEYQKVEQRIVNGPVYQAKQINIELDGKLDEWGDSEVIQLDQLKDAGDKLPEKEDFEGRVMVGWNEENPNMIYIGAVITDDILQDITYADGKWYLDDCLEVSFDFSENNTVEQLAKWVVGANGTDFSILANQSNTQAAVTREGNTSTYEIAIDITKIADGVLTDNGLVSCVQDKTIGFSAAYNDGEHNEREHQIGWTYGKSSDRSTMGNLSFTKELAK